MRRCIKLKENGLDGGPGEVRTLDLMTASHARSQLRHRPTSEMDSFLFVACARTVVNCGESRTDFYLRAHAVAPPASQHGDKGKCHHQRARLLTYLKGSGRRFRFRGDDATDHCFAIQGDARLSNTQVIEYNRSARFVM